MKILKKIPKGLKGLGGVLWEGWISKEGDAIFKIIDTFYTNIIEENGVFSERIYLKCDRTGLYSEPLDEKIGRLFITPKNYVIGEKMKNKLYKYYINKFNDTIL